MGRVKQVAKKLELVEQKATNIETKVQETQSQSQQNEASQKLAQIEQTEPKQRQRLRPSQKVLNEIRKFKPRGMTSIPKSHFISLIKEVQNELYPNYRISEDAKLMLQVQAEAHKQAQNIKLQYQLNNKI